MGHSKLGTSLNGQKIQPSLLYPCKSGDLLQLGASTRSYRILIDNDALVTRLEKEHRRLMMEVLKEEVFIGEDRIKEEAEKDAAGKATVFVGNMDFNTTRADLATHFLTELDVVPKEIRMPSDNNKGDKGKEKGEKNEDKEKAVRGYAFVVFDSLTNAKRAMAVDGSELLNRKLRVKMCDASKGGRKGEKVGDFLPPGGRKGEKGEKGDKGEKGEKGKRNYGKKGKGAAADPVVAQYPEFRQSVQTQNSEKLDSRQIHRQEHESKRRRIESDKKEEREEEEDEEDDEEKIKSPNPSVSSYDLKGLASESRRQKKRDSVSNDSVSSYDLQASQGRKAKKKDEDEKSNASVSSYDLDALASESEKRKKRKRKGVKSVKKRKKKDVSKGKKKKKKRRKSK